MVLLFRNQDRSVKVKMPCRRRELVVCAAMMEMK